MAQRRLGIQIVSCNRLFTLVMEVVVQHTVYYSALEISKGHFRSLKAPKQSFYPHLTQSLLLALFLP